MFRTVLGLSLLVTASYGQRSQTDRRAGSRPRNDPDVIFGGFSPIPAANTRQEPRRPLRFPNEEDVRRGNFIPESQSIRTSQRNSQGVQGNSGRTSGASRSLQNTPGNRFGGSVRQPAPAFQPQTPETGLRAPEFVSDYDYEYSYDYNYDDEPLPAGPTREPPLPSGPTRRPGQPTRQPLQPQVGVPQEIFNQLPLLTTRRPVTVTPRPNVNFRLSPPKGRKAEPQFALPERDHTGALLVTSDLDILDQTELFAKMDPHQEQFIKAPILNAGALPLAFESDVPLNRFPPFNLIDP